MNFLIDQSADARLVAWLTDRGHNAIRIGRDYPPGLADEEVLAIASRERRILISQMIAILGSLSSASIGRTTGSYTFVSHPSASLSQRRASSTF